ncbi:MAG: indolepyruvate ferredoxin oxidoreductase family protein, partial [Alphaproteobacteria bacterium]
MSLAAVSLDDKYALESGRVYLSGTQALIRLPMMQRQRDLRAGLDTAGYISGYRGSPLGGYDLGLWQAKKFLEQHHIRFEPGLNEDLAATAVWGTQQTEIFGGARYDGVFGIWYGKNPGVNRCGDVFSHATAAGTSAHGGVLAISGDDPGATSSSLPNQCEQAFIASMMPVLNPAGVREFIEFGLIGFALSRFWGAWVGFTTGADTIESSGSVEVDPDRAPIVPPNDFEMPPDGLSARWPDDRFSQDSRLQNFKLPAAQAFARANGLDRVVLGGKRRRFGVATTGKAYLDTRQALEELGIDDKVAEEIGLVLYKVGMTWPLEPKRARGFADGLEEIFVVEERRPLIETQLKEQAYNWDASARPRIVGKTDESGAALLPPTGEFNPMMLARAIGARIQRMGGHPRVSERLARLDARAADAAPKGAEIVRVPHFCAGCPHARSTVVPEGSTAMTGIGCHSLVMWMPGRNTITITHMGGEGVTWVGAEHFVDVDHMFQNLGDGTYYHSGLLAIRAAVAAKTNITYKILYNDAVAMTGGQPVEGSPSVAGITKQLHAEGVGRIAVVSDEPDKYPVAAGFAPGVSTHHRDEMDALQRELREWPGVSAIVYDQVCATEKRRRRKRGEYPMADVRPFINDLVCEGCGDCSEKSTCIAVAPLETELGRKRVIDQSACNTDLSCVDGFCPSFVTVHGGAPRKRESGIAPEKRDTGATSLPAPATAALDGVYGVMVGGVGGTGVITIGALLGMAAHLEGKEVSVLDNTGMARKGGAVTTQVQIAERGGAIAAPRIAAGNAELVIGCDMVVSASAEVLATIRQGQTRAVVNGHPASTSAVVFDPDAPTGAEAMRALIAERAGEGQTDFIDATRLATALLGDSIYSNLLLLGYACQKGLLPVGLDAVERAIEMNGIAVDANMRAFAWGRRAAHDAAAAEA